VDTEANKDKFVKAETANKKQTNKEEVAILVYAMYPVTKANLMFHTLMMFVAFYLSMLLTNWGDP